MRKSDYKWVRGFFWSNEDLLKLMMMVAQFYDYTRNHGIVCLIWCVLMHMNYMAIKNKFNEDTLKTDVSTYCM